MMQFQDREPMSLWSSPEFPEKDPQSQDVPTIVPYFPQGWKKGPQAVLVFPGGGYGFLAAHEGAGYAELLAANGITAFVVNYRIAPESHHPAMISDACRAVRLIRAHAAELGIDPHKIGVMGSSAGGHLAACCATMPELALFEPGEKPDVEFGRPDFSILAYPVISGTESWRHFGSFQNLLGSKIPDQETLRKLSPEQHVSDRTPPAFLWHTFEDTCVPMENSMAYASALRNRNIPLELHIYQKCEHGIGLGGGLAAYLRGECGDHPWGAECVRWVKSR